MVVRIIRGYIAVPNDAALVIAHTRSMEIVLKENYEVFHMLTSTEDIKD